MSSPAGRQWVVDASPIILLAKIGRAALLMRLANKLVIPAGVVLEIESGPADDPGGLWLYSDGAALIQDVGPVDAAIAAWSLGRGESEVLSFASRHPGFEAVVDDRAARSCAAALSIPVRGTIGIILLAKQEGEVALVTPILEELRTAGLRIDNPILETARRLAGEL